MHADVIVVGAGLAGMTAALAAEQAGADVILVDRGAVGTGTNSALSNAAFSGPVSVERQREYVELVLDVGKRLNRVAYVRRVASQASAAIAFLESLGLEIVRTPGQWMVRSAQPELMPGLSLVRRVAELVARRDRIREERGLYVTRLLKHSERVVGVRGVRLDAGERDILAPAVVLACGGAGAIYARHDNQANALGQGYWLAASAGLDLWDMEFVQCYPIVLDEPDMPMMMIYPPYPPQAKLVGPSGEDLLQEHGLGNINQAIIRKRDTFSAILMTERKAGPVCMDLRAVPEELWEVHPLSLLKRFKAECQTRPIRISPAVHFCMGGVGVDEEGQTSLGGLFACGEMVWGLHGANRMGGNALLECLVSGDLAGAGAARMASANPTPPDEPSTHECSERGVAPEPADLRDLRRQLQNVAWEHAGVVRSAEGMTKGLRDAERIWQKVRVGKGDTPKNNLLREDLLSAAFVLRAILTAGLGRLESRGSFLRSDYPAQDDARWLRSSRLAWNAAANCFSVEYMPVDL